MTRPPDGGRRVLVVDDEPQIRRLLTVSLARHGYDVQTASSGTAGVQRLAEEAVDIVLLDLGLPDLDGLGVVRRVREWSEVPIIIISVREDERDKVAALDLGADDYVTKPFGIDELLARMRAALRRTQPTPQAATISAGPLSVDFARRRVAVDAHEVRLTPTEYELLRILIRYRGRVITHRQLLREARGPAYEQDTPLLRVHMVGLRQKLGIAPGSPGYIATEPGIGYRLLE